MALADLLALNDLADPEIHGEEMVDVDLGLHRRHGIGIAVYLGRCHLFHHFLHHRRLFLGSLGGGEVQELQIPLLLNGIEEEIEPRSLGLIDQELVNVLEEDALGALELLGALLQAAHLGGNGIDGGVELVEAVAVGGEVGKELCHLFPGLFVQGFIDIPVAGGAQAVHLVGRTLLQPVLRPLQAVGKVGLLIGCPDFCKHSLQHGHIEVHHGTHLHQEAHGHGVDLPSLNLAVIHDGLGLLVGLAIAAGIEHPVKLEILLENALVEAEVEGAGGLGLGVEPEDHLGLVDL